MLFRNNIKGRDDMPARSQPLSEKAVKHYKLDISCLDERDETIISQHMGTMFDDILSGDRKISLKTRLGWKWHRITDCYYSIKKHHPQPHSLA
jgi:hypothetical protein